MTPTDTSATKPTARLDSWKEVAEYLRRDVRTCHRWEAEGMPIHRVNGGRGRPIFAFTHEIDGWLSGKQPERVEAAPHQCPALQQPCPLPPHCPARQHCVATALPCGAAAVRAAQAPTGEPDIR